MTVTVTSEALFELTGDNPAGDPAGDPFAYPAMDAVHPLHTGPGAPADESTGAFARMLLTDQDTGSWWDAPTLAAASGTSVQGIRKACRDGRLPARWARAVNGVGKWAIADHDARAWITSSHPSGTATPGRPAGSTRAGAWTDPGTAATLPPGPAIPVNSSADAGRADEAGGTNPARPAGPPAGRVPITAVPRMARPTSTGPTSTGPTSTGPSSAGGQLSPADIAAIITAVLEHERQLLTPLITALTRA